MKKHYFEKKTLSSFKKVSLSKWEGGKYACGSRPSHCIQISSDSFLLVEAQVIIKSRLGALDEISDGREIPKKC